MPPRRTKIRTTTVVLVVLLVLEGVLVISLRTLGWFGTGSAIRLVTCIFVTALPLLAAAIMLARNRFQFGIRSLLVATALFAVFLSVSLMPLLDHRSARSASMQLVSANATLNKGLDWGDFYSSMGLSPPPPVASSKATDVPPWLTPFAKHTSTIPPDDAVHSIGLNNDEQIQILANNWQRFSSLQSVGIASGVSDDGLELLQTTLARFEHLDCIQTHEVDAPKNWYRSLNNVRTLWVWSEGSLRGTPFPSDHLVDIASLPNLEVFMVLGYAFNDSDARTLSGSPSIRRVILRGTAVTPIGESDLADPTSDRIVYRN